MARVWLFAMLVATAGYVQAVRSVYKNCTHDDVYDTPTASYDLTGCANLNATGVMVDTVALARALQDSGAELESLRLVGNQLEPEEVATIADALGEHAALTNLHIGLNNVSTVGAEALGSALTNNTVVKKLSLSRTDMRNAGALAMSEMLRRNSALQDVNLEMNDITTAGISAISGALMENTVLHTLHIGLNPIFPAGASQIAKALRKNHALRVLNLRYGGLQDGGTVAIASALQENHHLRELDLWFNTVGDAGAAALGHMLKLNKGLTRLNLWDNQLSDVSIGSLAEGLAENRMCQQLHIGRNENITDGAAVHLQKALYVNEGLLFIDFGTGNTQVGEQFEKPLLKACKCNQQMRKAASEALVEDEQAIERIRAVAAQCRNDALQKVPMRISIKDMMRAQGIDPEERRKQAIEAAKNLDKLQKEMEKLSPEDRKEVQRLFNERKKMREEKMQGAQREARVPINSPHLQHQRRLEEQRMQQQKGAVDAEVDQAFGKANGDAPSPPPTKKKYRATREQQERNKKKREQSAKEEL